MKAIDNPKIYKWILVLSSTALSAMILFLVYNTYKLKDESLYALQKESMVSAYGQYIKNEKLFPGGNNIFAHYFETQLPHLLSIQDPALYAHTKDRVVRVLIEQLRQHQNFDSLYHRILKDQRLDQDFVYRLTFDQLEIIKNAEQGWETIYQAKADDPRAKIAGTLSSVSPANRALQLSVNNSEHTHNYRFTYSLYVDRPNRVLNVIFDMSFVLLLSAACIVLTIMINYRTFRNWVRQRKENQLKEDFIQHIRHEFNTPITTIVVAARGLYELPLAEANEAELRETSTIIERQGLRLRSYVKQILMSITIEDQEPELHMSDINELTAVLLRDITLRMENKLHITYQKSDKPIYALVDSLLYLCILDNVIDNAYKFNQERDKKVQIFWQDDEADRLRLCIQDNGEGINPEEISYIFQRFYRASSTHRKSGLGLGLYYSHLCAAKMNWEINGTVADQGKGTRIEIIISRKR